MTFDELSHRLQMRIAQEQGRFALDRLTACGESGRVQVDLVASEWCSLKERRAIENRVERWLRDEVLPLYIESAVVVRLHHPERD